MKHPYAPHGLDPTRHELSWWEASAPPLEEVFSSLQGDVDAEVAIIGGGFTGLSAALTLAKAGVSAVVLERAAIGWGASGRNGGFCCVGSAKLSYEAMIARHGLATARRFHEIQLQSVALVAERLASEAIEADAVGDGETQLARSPKAFAGFQAEAAFMRETFGAAYRAIPRAELSAHGTDGPHFQGGLHNPIGFGLHPLKYVRGLAGAARRAGARVHPRSEVTAWRREGAAHRLVTPRGSVKAARVIVATNGYTPDDLSPTFAGRVLPALSNILVTASISDDLFAAHGFTRPALAHDSRKLLHYFRRLPGNRFLFGGRAGLSAEPDALAATSRALEARFHALFPAWSEVEITHRWSGFVALAADLVPHVGRLPDDATIGYALAYHGNGVAMGTWSGDAVARLMMGASGPECPMIERPPPRFPLPCLRRLALGAAYLAYGVTDRFS